MVRPESSEHPVRVVETWIQLRMPFYPSARERLAMLIRPTANHAELPENDK